MIELTENEAKQIVSHVIESRGIVLSDETRLEVVIGVMAVCKGIQELGYRIARPLKAVEQ